METNTKPSLEPAWTAEEDKRIFDTFFAPTKTLTKHSKELSIELGRTAAAISTRWYKNLSPNKGKSKSRAKRTPTNLLSNSKTNKDKPATANPSLTVGAALMQRVLTGNLTASKIEVTNTQLIVTF